MVHKSIIQEAVKNTFNGNGFEAAARAHLQSLEDAGVTPEQIVSQLSDVIAAYASDGLQDEAKTLREIVRQYQMQWAKDGARPT
jgi:hypothetical protein